MKNLIKAPFRFCRKLYNLFIPALFRYRRDRNFRIRADYARYYDNLKIDDKTILYEAYHGRSVTGNPYAIYKYLLNDPKYKSYKHIWVVDNVDNPSVEINRNNPNTSFVVMNSRQYLKALTTAKYLINNTSFGFYFQKKKGQIYINTWHGTPLKTLGKDVEAADITGHKNIQRNFLHTDYFVSPNKFTTEKFFNSLDIHGIYNGKVLDIGYPRTDLTLNTNANKIKEELNIPKDKKIILYAPTWRGNSVVASEDESEKLLTDVEKLNEIYGEEYVVLLKVHMFVYKYLKEHGKEDLCVPNAFDTNELLSATEVLITDYSSIFFDFLPTRRPILFYMYDRDDYEKDRGFYFDLNDLPGPLCESFEEIVHSIAHLAKVQADYKEKYDKSLEKFSYKDDGHATERMINIVFEKRQTEDIYTAKNNKKKVLMYGGGFYNNGITISILNLVKYLDYDKYDLTLIDFGRKNKESTENIKRLDPRTRVIYRPGALNMRVTESYRDYFVIRKGLYKNWVKKVAPVNLYRKELKRIIGDTEFDVVIDFGGYNAFWSLLFAFSDIKKKSIFLHSDMMEEYNKKVNGKYKHRKNLRLMFSLYTYFDRVISVAKSANESNYQNLSKYIENADEKMVYVNNMLDYENVLELREQGSAVEFDNKNYMVVEDRKKIGSIELKAVIHPNPNEINFVNMGRLSPEKDQEKLILAFNEIIRLNPEKKMKLYIIGGGPLEAKLHGLVTSLNLIEKVIFTGHVTKPFALMNKCDCLLFSSNYEGQGLVVLESLILNKPVIATDVTGVRSILEDGYGMLVDNSIEGLVSGMQIYLDSGFEPKKFDYEAYNEEAKKMFDERVFN